MTGHPAVPQPNQNYPGMTHDRLKQLVTVNVDPGTAYTAGDDWKVLAGQLRDAAVTLDAAINGSQSHWEGAAADLARAHLAKVRDWSATTAEYFNATGTAMHDQVDAASKAKADMPDPVEFDPAKMIEQAAGNPIAMITLPVEMYATYQASTSAKDKAVAVIQTRDSTMQMASASIPAFTPPPDLGDGGSTTSTQSAGAGPVGAGGGVAAYHGTAGGSGYGGSGGYSPNGPGSAGYHPATSVPGGGSYTPGPVSGPGGGPTRVAGYDPGPAGTGYNPTGYGNGPAGGGSSPYGPGGPGGGGGPGLGVAGGFGPGGGGAGGGYRGGAGGAGGGVGGSSSSASSAAKAGLGSSAGAGGMGEEGAGARGGMGSAGAGAGGNAGMGAGGAGRGGKKEEDKEHKRPTFLVETDDVFGDGQMVAPTVIGENPTGGY